MSTRRRIQLAAPHIRRAAIVALVCFVVYVGAGFAVSGGFTVGPLIQAMPYLFLGVVIWGSVERSMPYRQFQFAILLLIAMYIGMGIVSFQQYVNSEVTAARSFLLLPGLSVLGLGLTLRGWWVARTA